MSIQIQRRICLDAKYLDKNLNNHILENIRESCKNECSQEYGYITEITKIIKIVDNYISPADTRSVFIVLFEAKNLKPEIGKRMAAKVCMIYANGILTQIDNKLKVLIPPSCLENYEYNELQNIFTSKNSTISDGDDVLLEIVGVKYSNKTFSCYANIVDDKKVKSKKEVKSEKEVKVKKMKSIKKVKLIKKKKK